MWNSFDTGSSLGITAEITTYEAGDGSELHAYVARPTGPGPFPAVVVLHHRPGWDEFYQEFTERLARHGYLAMAPDLYCRFGHGTPDDVAAKTRALGGVHDQTVVDDCAAVLAHLVARPDCTGKVGIIGGCSGGRHTVLVASRVPGFGAAVDLWGGNVVVDADQLSEASPVAAVDYTEQLNTPLLGLFGNEDRNPTPDQVDLHEAALARYGKEYEFHRYDGAGHSFFCYDTARYRPEQAIDGWNKVFAFFAEHLGS